MKGGVVIFNPNAVIVKQQRFPAVHNDVNGDVIDMGKFFAKPIAFRRSSCVMDG